MVLGLDVFIRVENPKHPIRGVEKDFELVLKRYRVDRIKTRGWSELEKHYVEDRYAIVHTELA